MTYRVFIVDDHPMVIEGIRSLLSDEKEIEWAGHAMSLATCRAFLQRQVPDVILMDISLPDGNGIELCGEVRRRYPSVFVIGLSTFSQQSFIHKIMEEGASGYLLKNATEEELLEAIREVVKGKIYLSEEASQVMKKDRIPGVVLTRREQEVLELIAEGLTNVEMAHRLFVSAATIDTHRKNLLTKLDAKNTAILVRKAVQLELIRF
ncbi:response regulator transcription factor [Niabella sp. CC-SYL272]|uniref:response regulator n=1 Tax=Niabella agricola TaxID=2891571 RepID=UPI001F1C2C35|nr:response regulator transcription factor [Niabella agricola]MCF3107580.1 response regulator transcription factor [Niabella agricola]